MYKALLDTCVLVPGLQRDFLLQLAAEGAYAAHWGSGILFELDYVLERVDRKRGMSAEESTGRREHLLKEMDRSFPGARVEAPKHRGYGYVLNDPDDQHVVHAALLSKADVLVTGDTTAKFEACPTLLNAGIEVRAVGDFVVNTVVAHPECGVRAVQAIARRSKNPPLNAAAQLDVLVRKHPSMRELDDVIGDRLREQ